MDTIEFVIKPSKILSITLWFGYILAVIILILLPFAMVIKIPLSIILFIVMKQNVSLHAAKKNPKSILRVWQTRKGQWGCQNREGYSALANLRHDSYFSSLLIILRFNLKNRIISVVIPKDSLSFEEFKILRARRIIRVKDKSKRNVRRKF